MSKNNATKTSVASQVKESSKNAKNAKKEVKKMERISIEEVVKKIMTDSTFHFNKACYEDVYSEKEVKEIRERVKEEKKRVAKEKREEAFKATHAIVTIGKKDYTFSPRLTSYKEKKIVTISSFDKNSIVLVYEVEIENKETKEKKTVLEVSVIPVLSCSSRNYDIAYTLSMATSKKVSELFKQLIQDMTIETFIELCKKYKGFKEVAIDKKVQAFFDNGNKVVKGIKV